MGNTKIIFEPKDSAKKACKAISYIVVNTKSMSIEEAQSSTGNYDNLILITTNQSAEQNIAEITKDNTEEPQYKNVVIVLVGQKQVDLSESKKQLGKWATSAEISVFAIDCENNLYSAAEEIAEFLGRPLRQMPDVELEAAIEMFLKKHNTCALATGHGDYVRCTPIEYLFEKGNLYIITEGGKKFVGILQNEKVCMAIFDAYTSMVDLKGLQVTGTAAMVPAGTEEFYEIFKQKKISPQAVDQLPIDMNVVRITPKKYEILSSEFKIREYDAKQRYLLK